jgi:hypothetical protein
MHGMHASSSASAPLHSAAAKAVQCGASRHWHGAASVEVQISEGACRLLAVV